MTNRRYSIIFQAVVFTIYIIFIWERYGVLGSISDSWYALEEKGWLFTLFIWAIALPMCFMNNRWYLLAGILLCFTGVAADFRESLTDKVHGIGAIGGIALSVIGLYTEGIRWPGIVGIIASLGIRYFGVDNTTWWIEILFFIVIMIGMWKKPKTA